jgi:hypothetical protein
MPHQQAGHMTAPDRAVEKSDSLLRGRSHPHMADQTVFIDRNVEQRLSLVFFEKRSSGHFPLHSRTVVAKPLSKAA